MVPPKTAFSFCWPAAQATSTHWICGWVHGRPRTLRQPRSMASIGRVDCCRIWEPSSLQIAFPSFEAASRSLLSMRLLQNWNQIARNPANATGKIAPNMGSVVALEKEPQRKTGQVLPGFLSLNGGGSLAGAGYFSGKYAPFDVSPSANGLSNLNHPRWRNCLHSSLQHADRWRCAITRHAVADRNDRR